MELENYSYRPESKTSNSIKKIFQHHHQMENILLIDE